MARPKGKDNAQQILHAFKDISFSAKRTETFGILGPNASGKTTLLKLVAGILKPTRDKIEVNGNIIAFLQLGLGFQDELTALENIYLYAVFLGMTKLETLKKLRQIIDFLN